jgi:hypothetical protein
VSMFSLRLWSDRQQVFWEVYRRRAAAGHTSWSTVTERCVSVISFVSPVCNAMR